MKRQRVLITGASGRIGLQLANHWREHHDLLLTDQHAAEFEAQINFQTVDLSDFNAMRPLVANIDTVIHLAADPNPKASWQSLLPNNVIASYNVLEAAAQAGCQRVIFASSVHVVAGYPADVQVTTTMPVAPANLYGAAKAFGEAMGRYYADHRNLSVLCVRLGTVLGDEDTRLVPGYPLLDIMLTKNDLLKLFDACLSVEHVGFGIFHGTSDNRFKRLDLSDTKTVLNYEPCDDAFVLTGMVDAGRPDHLFENH